jgi:dihydroneopterin aldolase
MPHLQELRGFQVRINHMKMKYGPAHIFVRNLRIYAYHGVMPQERRVGGEFSVSLRVAVDMTKASLSDQVEDTVSYADLKEVVKEEMAQPSSLLEHVAGRIARRVCSEFPSVGEVEVEIVKLNPPMGADCDGAGVSLCLINDKT